MKKIETGIPIPHKRIATTIYPFEAMKVSESFCAGKYSREKMQSVSGAISHFRKSNPEKKFSQRRMEDGTIRVWRIK